MNSLTRFKIDRNLWIPDRDTDNIVSWWVRVRSKPLEPINLNQTKKIKCRHCTEYMYNDKLARHEEFCCKSKDEKLPIILCIEPDKNVIRHLEEYGLDTSGTKQSRNTRLRDWIKMYNNNLESLPESRKSLNTLKSELETLHPKKRRKKTQIFS